MKSFVLLVLSGCLFLSTYSQPPQKNADKDPWEAYLSAGRESEFRNLQWNSIGPRSIGGHVSKVVSIPGRNDIIYAITGWKSVAVWKTEDAGYTWKPILEKAAPHYGDIAISASNPDILWIGSAEESWPARSDDSGKGIFKSTDGGESWENKGLHELPNINGIVISPADPDVVYAAGEGFRNKKSQRGVFKTIDGGHSWKQIFFIDSLQGMDELFMDPENHEIVYGYSRRRGDSSKIEIYKTENGGQDWSLIMDGLPVPDSITDIGMAVAPSNPRVIYALIKHNVAPEDTAKKVDRKIDIFRSDNRGLSWKKTGGQEVDFGYMVIKVSPDNEDELYLGSVHVWHSTDRGKTLKRIADNVFHIYQNPGTFMHLDQMDLWIDPVNTNKLILANDGGIYKTEDRGTNWLHMNSFPMGEFYYVATNKEDPVEIYSGNQDNSSVYGPGDLNLLPGFPDHWKYVRMDQWSGGDGFFTYPVPGMDNVFYFSYQFGDIVRKNMVLNKNKSITPKLKDGKIRKAWHTPILISHYNSSTLIYGGHYIMKSVNRGDSWTTISKDITETEDEKRKGGEASSLAESEIYEGLLYAGTGKGLVWRTKNGGREWDNITGKLPEGIISSIVASKFDSARVYLSISNKRDGDFNSYIYSSTDYGDNWELISGGIFYDPVNKIVEDPKDSLVLFAGTDKGVYVTVDQGKEWHSLSYNLPSCAVNDMVIHEKADMLIIGTYGRGIYSADISCLREYAQKKVSEKDYYLFDIKPAKELFEKPNLMRKAIFSFYVKDIPKKDLRINVLNDQDSVLYSIKPPVSKGFNQVTWDLRLQDPVIDSKYYNVLGKFLREGEYKVQMLIDEESIFEKKLVVEKYITDSSL